MIYRKEFYDRQPQIIGVSQFKKYAVIVPIIKTDEGSSILFEIRSNKLRRQPGEISFPGGHQEQGESLEECAIREATEELLVNTQQIEVLGPGNILVSPFNMLIQPYIGIIKDYQNTFSKNEVEEIFTVPLNYFLKNAPEVYKSKLIRELSDDFPYSRIPGGPDYSWPSGTYDTFFYHYKDYTIWGMTANIVQSTVRLMDKYDLI